MDIDQFIALLKKEIMQEATPTEQAQLQVLLAQNEDYQVVYQTVFKAAIETTANTSEAYERHIQRMRKNKLL